MANSRSIGSIYAELTLKDKMSSGLKKAQASLSKFASTSAQWAGAGLAAGVTAASVALLAGTKRTLSMTDELADMSAQTGIAIADMMKLQQAYKDGGREAANVGKDVSKMQKSLVTANGGGNDPFASMGLSAKELIKADPAKQFADIGAAIMKISNPAERTAKAMEIFGKGGMGLLTVFEGLPAAEKALGRMPELAQRFGAAMGEANDLIGHLPLKSDQFFMGFTAGIIGELLPGLQKIDNYDFTTLGENLGTTLAKAFSALTDGSMWEIWKAKGMAAFANLEASVVGKFDKEQAEKLTTAAKVYEAVAKGLEMNLQHRFDANRNAAAKLSTNPVMPNGDLIPTIKPDLLKPLSVTDRGVNDYQRRGLSLSGATPVATEETKQTGLLTEMRDALKRMAERPMTASF